MQPAPRAADRALLLAAAIFVLAIGRPAADGRVRAAVYSFVRIGFLGILLFAAIARAQPVPPHCPGLDACADAGHQFTRGSTFPYSEDNAAGNPIVLSRDSGWTLLQSGCADNGRVNVMAGAAVNLRVAAYLRIDAATAAPGAHYEVQFLVDGNPVGWYVRAYRGLIPQGDHFNAVLPNLAAGDHTLELRARLNDPGTLTFTHEVTTSIGAPIVHPAFSQANASRLTIGGTWQQASDTITFTNDSSGDIDVMPQAYVQIDAAAAGDHLSFGFSLDGNHSEHTSDIGAPAHVPDGINVFDAIANVPPGTHTLSFWVIDRDGGTFEIRNRQIEMISFPSAENNGRSDHPLLTAAIATAPVDVDASSVEHPNFKGTGSTDGGGWTKILEVGMPPTGGYFNYTGDAFVELLGTKDDAPPTAADIAIELVSPDGGISDAHWVSLSVPRGRGEVYIFADSLGWSDTYGETVRLWMRPRTDIGSGSAFRVGKRYLALKLVPVDGTTCYN